MSYDMQERIEGCVEISRYESIGLEVLRRDASKLRDRMEVLCAVVSLTGCVNIEELRTLAAQYSSLSVSLTDIADNTPW